MPSGPTMIPHHIRFIPDQDAYVTARYVRVPAKKNADAWIAATCDNKAKSLDSSMREKKRLKGTIEK